ncbi:unnamed protein product [Lepeophtheirus salmonis]|uniref:(salmon louse) hypothetical protein n=1 Tax=Lepeophtheirus salmonis TaxID=72036 RepID=A0A7R8CSM0_LEPSM|nr:unnamed protein product [Lepeophtheirus salmonis]CAF2878869.1 unnamed protein product [Lepeophtheirus salmonis]
MRKGIPTHGKMDNKRSSGRRRREIPWQVAIVFEFKSITVNNVCGGSIIGTYYVLSAAHCFDGITVDGVKHDKDLELSSVYAGGHLEMQSGKEYKMRKVLVHPAFARTAFIAPKCNDRCSRTMRLNLSVLTPTLDISSFSYPLRVCVSAPPRDPANVEKRIPESPLFFAPTSLYNKI